jgi:F-type H+-transporting ATPase subunit epsilon
VTATTRSALEVDIIAPAGVIDRGEAGFVSAMSAEGELGVLPGHASLVARLGIGEVRVHRGADRFGDVTVDHFAIKGGILQVERDHVILLVPQAVAAADVDVDAVRTALAETIEALAHPESDERFEELLGERKWCEARLSIVRKSGER